jgi:tRNA(Ile)-lysidine synthase
VAPPSTIGPVLHTLSVPSALESRVADHCRRHGLLPSGGPVLAMVSGGADSTCLMHLLIGIHDGPVGVLAVDHGLREASRHEAEGVREAAAALGLTAHVERIGLAPGAGVQERARTGRLAAAGRVARENGYERIATGHTASDQAETVLFRLARGTGRTGALGMAPRRGRLVRPLLCATAAETRRWCAQQGLEVVEDPSNSDPAHARTRVRAGLLPALAAIHPGAEAHLAAAADLLRDEAELLEPLVEEAWERVGGGPGLDPGGLAGQPRAMRRLLARRLIAEAGLGGDALGGDSVARVLETAADGRRRNLPGGGGVALEGGRLVAFGPAPGAPTPAPLAVPGATPFGGVVVRAAAAAAAPPTTHRVAVRLDGPATVRSPRPGDRLTLSGGGRRAVGRLLADAGVPARLRHLVPVVVSGERVVWVAGHRAAADLVVRDGSEAVVLELCPA